MPKYTFIGAADEEFPTITEIALGEFDSESERQPGRVLAPGAEVVTAEPIRHARLRPEDEQEWQAWASDFYPHLLAPAAPESSAAPARQRKTRAEEPAVEPEKE